MKSRKAIYEEMVTEGYCNAGVSSVMYPSRDCSPTDQFDDQNERMIKEYIRENIEKEDEEEE